MTRLQGKVAVVTGGGRGIGKATAMLFAEEGAAVVVDDIVAERARAVAAEIEAKGGTARAAACDVSKRDQVKVMLDEAEAAFGQVNILVNNAIPETQAVMSDDWRVVEVGLGGTYFCTLEAIEKMKKAGGGSVVSISSVNALAGFGDIPIYAGVKAGVIGMMRTFALSYGKHQIRFNTICPGTVVTEIWGPMIEKEPGILDRLRKLYPMGKLGKPLDIARAALFLASDESDYATGGVFIIDGGITTGLMGFHG
ncbi:MAG: SDR family oxidoreductase [Planctomycetes bacterium]|nr:SDR family oxidoreductase [Planctomycetota bacterium]